jgi:hypothetical protein
MVVFFRYLFNEGYLGGAVRDDWLKLYDKQFVDETIEKILSWSSEMSALLDSLERLVYLTRKKDEDKKVGRHRIAASTQPRSHGCGEERWALLDPGLPQRNTSRGGEGRRRRRRQPCRAMGGMGQAWTPLARTGCPRRPKRCPGPNDASRCSHTPTPTKQDAAATALGGGSTQGLTTTIVEAFNLSEPRPKPLPVCDPPPPPIVHKPPPKVRGGSVWGQGSTIWGTGTEHARRRAEAEH